MIPAETGVCGVGEVAAADGSGLGLMIPAEIVGGGGELAVVSEAMLAGDDPACTLGPSAQIIARR